MNKKLIIAFVGILLAIGLGAFWAIGGGDKTLLPAQTPAASINPDTLAGVMTGAEPWSPEIDHLKDRLTAIGLPALATEGTVLHTHQHIDIYVDGNPVGIPEGIGINEAANFIAPIHTHDKTAVIHVESPTIRTFTLGQFFDIWGVRFTQNCLGSYCNAGDKTLKVFSNGKAIDGNFRDLALVERQEIVVTFGTDARLPSPIPSTFSFPSGL